MDLKKRLAQLDRLSRRPADAANHELLPTDPIAAVGELDLRETDTPAGPVWSREYRDPLACPTHPLPDMREIFTSGGDPGPGPRDILFLDTETTGLSGGTGTIAFMVGVSWWDQSGLVTRQFFLPGPGHEGALLGQLAGLAERFRVVVTFNGASFDLPLLRTRARLNRVAYPLAGLAVWDLLGAARRLFGNRLPDCRQQTLERDVCGLRRGSGDLEGSRIPQTWFDFLATGRVGLLPRVFTHNHLDMVGMGEIFCRVNQAAILIHERFEPAGFQDWRELWALGRVCERRRDTPASLTSLKAAVAAAPRNPGLGLGHHRFLGDALRILKRSGDWILVEKVILDGLAAGVDEPWLHREAAILYEHRLVQPAKALDHALKSGEDRRVERLRKFIADNNPVELPT